MASVKTYKSQAGVDPKDFKATIADVPLRIYKAAIKNQDIIAYDFDNCYPQRMKIMSDGSVLAKRCKKIRIQHVLGKGFVDKAFEKTMLNDKDTAGQVLRKCVNDVGEYEGMAFWVGYNALLEVSSIKHLPFNYVRLTDPEGDHPDKYAVHADWAGLSSKKFDPKLIDYIDKFDPDPDKISAQINNAGSFDEWRGQILWMPLSMQDEYPETIYDSAFHAISTDVEIDLFKYRNVSTSFLAYYIYRKYGAFESDQAREEFMQTLNSFQGGRQAAKIMLVEGQTQDTKDEIEKVDVNNNDKLFNYHEESVNEKIRLAFSIPRELTGEDSSSGFDSDRVEQAFNRYNTITEDERSAVKTIFEMVMKHATPSISGSGNYAIDKLSFSEELVKKNGQKKEKSVEVEKLALNGAQITAMKDIIASVTLGEIPKESAKAIVLASFPSINTDLVDQIFDSIGSSTISNYDTH